MSNYADLSDADLDLALAVKRKRVASGPVSATSAQLPEGQSLMSGADMGKVARKAIPIVGGGVAGMVGGPIVGGGVYTGLEKVGRLFDRGGQMMPFKEEMAELGGIAEDAALLELGGGVLGKALSIGGSAIKRGFTALRGAADEGISLGKLLGTQTGPEELHRVAPIIAKKKMAAYAPTEDYDPLFKQAEEAGGQIATPNTLNAIMGIEKDVNRMSSGAQKGYAASKGYGQGLKDKIEPGYISPSDIQAELKFLGSKVPSETLDQGMKKQLFRGMAEDLDAAGQAGTPGAAELQKARQTFKRAKATEALTNAIDDATMNLQGQGEHGRFAANKILNQIQRGEGEFAFFNSAFSPEEKVEIVSLFEAYNKLPALQPPGGSNFGSGKLLGGSGVLGAIGFGMGGASGAGIGYALPIGKDIANNFRVAMSLPQGRSFLAGVLKEKGSIGLQQALTAMGQGGMEAKGR